jgi:chemotaxis protein MotB
MASEEDVPIRIIRKKVGHGGHHGGAWKVAYADFVTAMMALFIVLWIIGQSKQVKDSVAGYFRDPGAFESSAGGGGALQHANAPLSSAALAEQLLKRERQRLEELAKGVMKSLEQQPGLKKLAGQIKIEMVKEGMRIELMETSESFFFDVGTAELKPEAREVVRIIGEELARLPNHFVIEGHTDSRPYQRPDGYSNYELSVDRANSARRMLVVSGMKAAAVDEVRGYADKKLRNAADPFDVTNRRISVLVKFLEGEGRGPEDDTPHR